MRDVPEYVVSRDGFKDDDDDDDESACYRTTTTSQTSSSIACVDVCVEFPRTALTKQKKKENSNRACRSQPYGKEGEIDSKLKACERACLDAHAASVALKFPDDKEETRRDYGVVAKNECAKRCATSFPKAEEQQQQQQQQH